MKATTIFTWGYYGWGNHTPQLVEAVDAVETSRGFEPPFFVDIRIRRNVRAKGFLGRAFEKRLGPSRHRWLKSLGNKCITKHKKGIEIADPSAAEELLDMAINSARRKQRLLFFCSCQWPRCDEKKISCHRTTVAGLVLKAAKKRGAAIEIVEWPGGDPKQIELDVTPEVFAAVSRGRKTVSLDKRDDLAKFAGLPWCSVVKLKSEGQKLHRIVGRAIRQPEQWVLPVLSESLTETATLTDYQEKAGKLRRSLGLDAESSHQKQ